MSCCDKNEIIARIQRRLGYPLLCVELSVEHWEDAWTAALCWFTAHQGQIKEATISYAAGEYEFDTASDCVMVTQVIFPGYPRGIFSVYRPWGVWIEPTEYSGSMPIVGGAHASDWQSALVQGLQMDEVGRRILDIEREWQWDVVTRKLRIFPSRGQDSGTLMYRYVTENLDEDRLKRHDCWLIERYARAVAKEMLGRIRSKYGGWPGAGGDIQLDGDALLQEAMAEIEKLDEEIQWTHPMPFLTG